MHKYIGSFELKSDQLIVSDPFSISNSNMLIENVIPGVYFCFLSPTELLIYHSSLYQIESTIFREVDKWQSINKNVPIDHGLIGIYDSKNWSRLQLNEKLIYPPNNLDDPWESFINDLAERHTATAFEAGCISKSGQGDGNYPIFTLSINNLLKGIKVVFK